MVWIKARQQIWPKLSGYQDAVEELVDEQAKHADDDVGDVQEEEDIHDDRFVPSCERALVSHETHQEDNLIQELREKIIIKIVIKIECTRHTCNPASARSM